MKQEGLSQYAQMLEATLDRLKTHLAWLGLFEEERRRGEPPVLLMKPDLAAGIRNDTALFMSLATHLHDFLNRLPEDGRQEAKWTTLRSNVLQLEAEFQRLPLPKPL